MSKNFRPLFGVYADPETGGDSFKNELQKILEEKQKLEEELSILRERLSAAEEEKKSLQEKLNKLNSELSEKSAKLESLISELVEARLKKSLTEKFVSKVEETIKQAEGGLKEEFVSIAKELLKDFLMTDMVPKEELVVKVLEEVFNTSFELKGNIKLRLNSTDIDKVFDFIASLKEKLGGRVDIDVVTDENIKPGEFELETPKFVIERKHEEAFEEIFQEVVKRVLEGD